MSKSVQTSLTFEERNAFASSLPVTVENDVSWLFYQLKQHDLPDALQTKRINLRSSKYDQLPTYYLRYPLKRALIEVKKAGFLPVILLTGFPNTGKTSVGLGLADWFSKAMGYRFDLSRCFLIGRNESLVIEEIKKRFKPGDLLFIDEIQHFIHGYRTTADVNVEFGKFIDACRKYGILAVMGTAPRFDSVDRPFAQEQVQVWLHVNWKGNGMSRCYINVNTQTVTGRELKYTSTKNVWFKWAPDALYDYSLEAGDTEIYEGKSLGRENVLEKKKRMKKEEKKKEFLKRINIVLKDKDKTGYQKIMTLLRMGLNMKKTTGYLRRTGYDVDYEYVQSVRDDLDMEMMKEQDEETEN